MSLSIGLVGCGKWGRHILRDLRSLGCHVPVVARSTASIGHAQVGGADAIVESVEALPLTCDGYVVATNLISHAQIVRALIPRGRPIFVEKPFTDDPVTAHELAALAPERIFLMDKWRYHAGIEALRNLVRRQELGEPRFLHTRRNDWGTVHDDCDAVWTLLPHDLSIAQHLFGTFPTITAATAERDGSGTVTGLHAIGHLAGIQVHHEVSASSFSKERSVRIMCRDGVALLPDSMSDHLLIRHGHPSDRTTPMREEKRPIPVNQPLYDELAAFVRHVQGGPAPMSSAAEGAGNVACIATCRALAGV